MLDKRGKLFGKVSIVDILVVLIVLIMAVGGFATWQKINNNVVLTENKGLVKNNALDTLAVTMRFKEVRQMTLDALKVGDEVFMEDTGKYLGEIVSVTPEPATRLIYDMNGKVIDAPVPERMDVLVVVHVPGKRLQNGYFTADNIQLAYDSTFEVKTPTVQSIPFIETIKTVSE
ncbi:MAG: DUF4330 domain-containing protein [Clostridia bacterium]|nr:DUF4330 domain-containing protein [Clostridia bacterium]